jgi:hypothetical protein
MTDEDKKWLVEGGEKLIAIACGGTSPVNLCSVTGYCSNSWHRGYVTKTVFKRHKCIEKGCRFFEKFDEFPYWIRRAQSESKKFEKKQELLNEELGEIQD